MERSAFPPQAIEMPLADTRLCRFKRGKINRDTPALANRATRLWRYSTRFARARQSPNACSLPLVFFYPCNTAIALTVRTMAAASIATAATARAELPSFRAARVFWCRDSARIPNVNGQPTRSCDSIFTLKLRHPPQTVSGAGGRLSIDEASNHVNKPLVDARFRVHAIRGARPLSKATPLALARAVSHAKLGRLTNVGHL